jgi:hypothetical protein
MPGPNEPVEGFGAGMPGPKATSVLPVDGLGAGIPGPKELPVEGLGAGMPGPNDGVEACEKLVKTPAASAKVRNAREGKRETLFFIVGSSFKSMQRVT